jgi:DNA polymerase III subunit epsilon
MLPLSEVEVLAVDCQATAAAPHGHLLELAWAHVGASVARGGSRLIALPDGERIPRAVTRVTGIGDAMARRGVGAAIAIRELVDAAAALPQQPAPTIVHFARFEEPYLRSLADGASFLDIVCTHRIARRLLPGLPRCSLRALAGYFGRSVGALRRSADHVEATAFVWRELVRLLDDEGVSTWTALQQWLSEPSTARKPRRVWPMPRASRLSLPDAPGVYRMLRTSGDVLYVGKARSLRRRVNSYFRHQHGVPERTLEMLSQARDISFEVTPSALEAALVEADEIKDLRPPYNVALASDDRAIWFATPDLAERRAAPSAHFRVGPFPSSDVLDEFAALSRGDHALLRERWRVPDAMFTAGCERLRCAHPELTRRDVSTHLLLRRVGTRLWREGRRDRAAETDDESASARSPMTWTPSLVQFELERLVLRTALACRRAQWLTRLVDVAIVWCEPHTDTPRLMVIENGAITARDGVARAAVPPIPPGHDRPTDARHTAFDLATFDRLRVLTTELKRVISEGGAAAVRFGPMPALSRAPLVRTLSWM